MTLSRYILLKLLDALTEIKKIEIPRIKIEEVKVRKDKKGRKFIYI